MGNDFRSLEGFLRLTMLRHGVIASNIANVDTPGYKVRDVVFPEVLQSEILNLRTTHPLHIKGISFQDDGSIVVQEIGPWKDGNNVELDLEMAKMAENAILFQTGITLLSSKIRMYKNALRR